MSAFAGFSRRSRFAFPLLAAVTAVAGLSPMLTAPHEANACSGAGLGPSTTFYREVTPTIETATATERDHVVVLTKQVAVASGPGSIATSGHLEAADGTLVPLSRNDLAPGAINFKARRVLVPKAPLEANEDYTLVIEGVVTGTDPSGPVATARLPFKTGDKLHQQPPTPAITGEASRGLQPEHKAATLCCGQSADYTPGGCGGPGKGTPATCVTSKREANEEISVTWVQSTGEAAWGGGVEFEMLTTAPGITNPIRQPLSVSPVGLAGDPFPVVLGAGGKACVTIVATDRDTGVERSSPQVCYSASADVEGPRTSCEDLVPLMSSPQWKAGCEKNEELLTLLKDCPVVPGNTGAAGSSGSSGSSGPPGSSGSSGAAATGPGASPAAASGDDGGCSLVDVARSDGTAALAPLFAALAGMWVARRRR